MNSETPETDAAKEARFRYTSQWTDEDKAKMLTASQEEQMEWVKNCPPDGWEIARRLELRNRRLVEALQAIDNLRNVTQVKGPLEDIGFPDHLVDEDGWVEIHPRTKQALLVAADMAREALTDWWEGNTLFALKKTDLTPPA